MAAFMNAMTKAFSKGNNREWLYSTFYTSDKGLDLFFHLVRGTPKPFY